MIRKSGHIHAGLRRRVRADTPCRSTRRAFFDPEPGMEVDYRPRETRRLSLSFSRVCQPRPPSRKCASTSLSSLRVTCSLVGAFCGPRCPGRRKVAPRQNAATAFGSFGSYGSAFGSNATGAPPRASTLTRAQSVRLRFLDGFFIHSPFRARSAAQRDRLNHVHALDIYERQQHVFNPCKIDPSRLAFSGGLDSQLRETFVHAPCVRKIEAVLGEVRFALTLIPDDHELIVATISSGCKRYGCEYEVIG